MYGVRVDESQFGMNRDQLRAYLADRGIETRTFFIPMHLQPIYYERYGHERYPNAELLCKTGFYLPSSSSLKASQIDYIVSIIREAHESVQK
jgi:perosamine synthetase